MRWKRVSLIGVGLLGGSLGLALKKRRLAESVVGFVRRAASVRECRRRGAVDVATLDLASAVTGSDLVVLCTPIAQMRPLAEQMATALTRGAIVTDVGSVKGPVVRDLEALVGNAGGHFVGSHPMAGSEKMGVAAASAELFIDAVCVVTPSPSSDSRAARKIQQLWKSVGARLLTLSPEAHDELVSRSSHLPHVVAATLANLVLAPEHPPEQAQLCANGFRDTTRIASGSPEMWRDIAFANRENLSRALAGLIEHLGDFRRALQNQDSETIASFFHMAKQRRDRWSGKLTSRSPE